jgi:hypothetical protein
MSKKVTLREVNKCIEDTLLRKYDLWFDKREPLFIVFCQGEKDAEVLFSENTFLTPDDGDGRAYDMDVAAGVPYRVRWLKRIYGEGSYLLDMILKVNYDAISPRNEPISDMLEKAIKDAYGSMTAPEEQSAQAVADWLIGYMKLDDVPEKYFHLI